MNIAVKRLSTIQFENVSYKIKESHHVLIREYFRRINVFLDNVDIVVDKYPIFSISKVLGKTLEGDIFNVCPKVGVINNLYIKAICLCYLEISELADEGVSEAIEYIDLYEPIIKFLERGGDFSIRQGEMIVGSSSYPLKYWRDLDIPVNDISDVSLDRIDKKSN
ncbi:hypothetical protein ACQKII_17165 [Lysinibacillus sp. NPDC048646]|uniref:hypothetical protein n=1 Tax=Lysinibacillus sp. NPDC048646 TaxID=3390574 RepID=UPI003D0773B7